MPPDNELLAAALAYAARGWAVFPVHSPGPRGGCSCAHPDCSSPAKHPRIAGGLKAASTDPVAINGWWRRWPRANVAVRTGAVSGMVVVDVDPEHGGKASIAALAQAHGPFPQGPVVCTGGGGWHLYLAHPGVTVRNDAGRRLGRGVDVRGDGGYAIVPPSAHAAGAIYVWRDLPDELPPLPGWLAACLVPRQRPSKAQPMIRGGGHSNWASEALRAAVATMVAAPVGARNHTLNRTAFIMGQIAAGGSLDAEVVQIELMAAAARAGLGAGEARATLASGLGAGMRRRRVPQPVTAAEAGHDGTSW
ncbi:MAG TPA: bifunctional DNA primase/polymerase [Acidimicrobiales bacterium]|nr:bifunctional DNA primase/polymerase [Acidimicrobiales bacterium]